MKNVKCIALLSILLCLVIIPSTFAADNETVLSQDNETALAADDSDILTQDYYFDANIENDTGNGSADNPYKTLTSGRIPENSIIHLNDGEYDLDYKLIKNVTIIGKDPETTIIKNVEFDVSISPFCLYNVTLLDCKIENINSNNNYNNVFKAFNTKFINSGATNSWAIYSRCIVELDKCTISNFNASNGGAIYITRGIFNINNTLFLNNYASGQSSYESDGGAIYVTNAILNINNTKFVNSHAFNYGGVIAAVNDANVIIDNSIFENSYSSGKAGGVIYVMDSNLTMSNSQLINSTAVFGGAIASINSALNITNVTARNNKAKYYGGVIYSLYGNSIVIINSTFENNSARDGGALFIDDSKIFKVENNYFANNTANYSAGAVCAIANNGTIADNNIFANNSAILENDVYQSSTPNMEIGDGNYTLIYYDNATDGDLPSRYDLRDLGYVTPVKAQEGGGNCWAFASIAALESCLLKATGIPYDLSEENMKNLMYKFSDYGWDYEPNTGGLDDMAVGYLVSWLGPVNESVEIYNDSSFLSPALHSFLHVQNVVYLTRESYTDNDRIKRAIMDYGAVSTSVAWYPKYRNQYTSYCYDENEKANHAVAIVGWDDNYSKSNFKGNPEGDGAWIIKNSWGTDSGDKGFFYVSYYDRKLAQPGKPDITYTFILNDTIKYDKNYQYDIPGKTDFFLNESSTVWYKNIFNATGNEYLAAVSTFFANDTNYEISIYVNNDLKLTQEGFSKEGYYTISLNQFIPLTAGDTFEIVFKITVDKEARFPVSEKVNLEKLFYRENISFLSYDGIIWKDLFNLTWNYSSHHYNSQVACIKAFTVFDLINTTTQLNVNVTDTLNIEATVLNQYSLPVYCGNVTFTVNGDDYTVAVKNGKALLQLPFIKGEYNISVLYNHSLGFKSSKDNVSLNYSSINTTITFSIDSEYNPINITANVLNQFGYPLSCGNVTFTVEGKDYTLDLINGTASLIHIFASSGSYGISVTFSGFDYYNPSSYSDSISANVPSTYINFNIDDKFNPYNIVAVVTDPTGKIVDLGNVTFTVENENITVPIIGGSANLTHSFANYGINNIFAYFSHVGFESSYSNEELYVHCEKADMELSIAKQDYINIVIDVCISEMINDTANVVVASRSNASSYKINLTDGKGQLKLYGLAYGAYRVTVSVENDIYYIADADATFTIDNIATHIDADDLEMYYNNETGEYFAYLYDSENNPLVNKIVIFSINGADVVQSTDRSGKAALPINYTSGSYKVRISFSGDEIYLKSEVTKNIIIKSTLTLPKETTYTLNSKYVVILVDRNGNPLANQTVSLKINSDIKQIKTDANGKLTFAVDLKPAQYTIEIANSKTGEVKTQKITVVKRITENKAVTMYYGAGKYYKVKVFDDNGKIAKGVKVKFTIKGKSYTRTTDSKGYASFKITQTVGKYTITAEYKGFKVSNKITVKSTIVTKNIKVKKGKTIKFTAKLLNKNGKILKSKKITFKFKGKTYKVKTNKKGIATLKITKKYKVGKYTISSAYGGLTVKNKINIVK